MATQQLLDQRRYIQEHQDELDEEFGRGFSETCLMDLDERIWFAEPDDDSEPQNADA